MRRRTYRGRKARLFTDIARGAADLVGTHPNATIKALRLIADTLIRLENELEEDGRREELEERARVAAAAAKARTLAKRGAS